MTRGLTAALRRALASGRKVLGPAGVSSRVDEEDEDDELEEDELSPAEQPLRPDEELDTETA